MADLDEMSMCSGRVNNAPQQAGGHCGERKEVKPPHPAIHPRSKLWGILVGTL